MNRRNFIVKLVLWFVALSSNFITRTAEASEHLDTVELMVRNVKGGKLYKADIDACIAPIVQALQDADIITTRSCCGHFKTNGYIVLEDRVLEVTPQETKNEVMKRYKRDYEPIGMAWDSLRDRKEAGVL